MTHPRMQACIFDTGVLLVYFLAKFEKGRYLHRVVDRKVVPARNDSESQTMAYRMVVKESYFDRLFEGAIPTITPYVLSEFFYLIKNGIDSSEKLKEFLLEFGEMILRMKEIQISKEEILCAKLLHVLGPADISLLLLSERNGWPILSFDRRMPEISRKVYSTARIIDPYIHYINVSRS